MKRDKDAYYFLSLTLENVGCFGKPQTLELKNEDNGPARWTVIVGDNAYGKTTLLRSLVGVSSYSIYEPESMVFGIKGLNWNYSRDDEPSRVEATFSMGRRFTSGGKDFDVDKRTFEGNSKKWSKNAGSVYSDREALRFVCYGYGAARRMGKSGLSPERKDFKALSLFDDDTPLIDAEDWLLQADYVSAKNKKYMGYKKQVEDIILHLLPDVKKIDYRIGKGISEVRFQTSFGRVGINELSLGYRTMLAWTVDFAASLFERYPESKNPLEEPAVLLVDEIDLHLHPKWQRILVDFLTERFPNTQFIATAHSPLLVQSAADANLILLRREGTNVIIDNDPISVKNWRVDQILTSDLFGLESARPKEVEGLLKERTAILSKARLSPKDRQRLSGLEADLDAMPFGETPEEIKADSLIKEIARKISIAEKSRKKDHDG